MNVDNPTILNRAQSRVFLGKSPGYLRGFTLIELMISISLGLVFISGAIAFLLSSRTLHEVQEASSRAQENAQFATDTLTYAIRMAGYHNITSPGNKTPAGQFYTGQCGDFDPCTSDGSSADVNGSDRIAILVNPPEDDGTDADCAGTPISSNVLTASRSVVVNLFRIMKGEHTNTLVCDSFLVSSTGVLVPINDEPYDLIDGIDSMQILYGVSDIQSVTQTNVSLERYLSATRISTLVPPKGAPSAWINLLSVRFSLLVGSGTDDAAASEKNSTFQLLDADPIAFNDSRYRKVSTSTVQINNARL